MRDCEPGTEIVWAIRGGAPGRAYGGGDDDQLPARGAIGDAVRGLVARGEIELIGGFQTRRVDSRGGRLVVGDGERDIVADEIIACTGFRPDLSILAELRLDLDDRVEAARALAPLIDPNHHSCGSVPPHGVDELGHPDEGVYEIGVLNSDPAKQLGATELGARVWRLKPGEASRRHRHARQTELYGSVGVVVGDA